MFRINRVLGNLAIILVSASCIGASAPSPFDGAVTISDRRLTAALDGAEMTNRAGDYDRTALTLKEYAHSELYADLSPAYRERFDRLYGRAQLMLLEGREAHAVYVRLTASPG